MQPLASTAEIAALAAGAEERLERARRDRRRRLGVEDEVAGPAARGPSQVLSDVQTLHLDDRLEGELEDLE